MAELLTDAELLELTGVEQPAAQIRVLREHGLQPIVRRDGRPRLTWAAITAACTGTGSKTIEPDFTAMR